MIQDKRISMEEFRGGIAKSDLVKLREAITGLRETSDMVKEYWKIQAGIMKAKYDALVLEGFAPQQALELCKGT